MHCGRRSVFASREGRCATECTRCVEDECEAKASPGFLCTRVFTPKEGFEGALRFARKKACSFITHLQRDASLARLHVHLHWT